MFFQSFPPLYLDCLPSYMFPFNLSSLPRVFESLFFQHAFPFHFSLGYIDTCSPPWRLSSLLRYLSRGYYVLAAFLFLSLTCFMYLPSYLRSSTPSFSVFILSLSLLVLPHHADLFFSFLTSSSTLQEVGRCLLSASEVFRQARMNVCLINM